MENYTETCIYSKKSKKQWWGKGEWVDECDLVTFEYVGIECMVKRIAKQELYTKDINVFGGHLCGYVSIPSDHPCYYEEYNDINVDCHGGLTFGECMDKHWIGFDCGHLGDYVPSIEHLKKTAPYMQEYREHMEELSKQYNVDIKHHLFNKTYKNIAFVIGECKLIVEQLVDMVKVK
jgi:hypothetical protein